VQKNAIEEGLEFHRGLVSLNLRQNLAALHGITYVLQPAGHHAFRHGVTQLGHAHNLSHLSVL
jgi:hypothetical protein